MEINFKLILDNYSYIKEQTFHSLLNSLTITLLSNFSLSPTSPLQAFKIG